MATFLVGLWAFNTYDRFKFRHIAETRFIERNRSFEEFLTYHGQSLKTLAEDLTSWDQMVAAIGSGDAPWFAENVNHGTLDSFHANVIWIYRTDGTLVHQVSNLNAEALPEFPLPQSALTEVFAKDPRAHFFVRTPEGIMEIRATRSFKVDDL